MPLWYYLCLLWRPITCFSLSKIYFIHLKFSIPWMQQVLSSFWVFEPFFFPPCADPQPTSLLFWLIIHFGLRVSINWPMKPFLIPLDYTKSPFSMFSFIAFYIYIYFFFPNAGIQCNYLYNHLSSPLVCYMSMFFPLITFSPKSNASITIYFKITASKTHTHTHTLTENIPLFYLIFLHFFPI